jgi:recombination protein RecT
MSKELTKMDNSSLRGLLEKAAPRLAEVAPKHLKVERMTRLLLAATMRNPKILQCTPDSVLQFAMKCSETGLEPIGAGGAWPVPYENRKAGTVELQFIPDYRGLINVAKMAGCIKDAYAEVVKENDEFYYELGLEPKLTHRPARGNRGKLESAYCIIVLPDDTKRFVVMDADEIAAIRGRSKTGHFGPWQTDEGEMWKKTLVRRAMKPFSGAAPELSAAIEADNAASGISFAPDPISMPKAKGQAPAELPENTQPQGEDPAPAGEAPPEFTPDTPQKTLALQLSDAGITEADFFAYMKEAHGFKRVRMVASMTDAEAEDALFALSETIEKIKGGAK